MIIVITNLQKDLPLLKKNVRAVVQNVLQLYCVSPHQVFVHFVTKKKISSLHQIYFDDPTPTDCISFPIDTPQEKNCDILGEIFICPKVAIEYAKKHKIDALEETTLYIVHGLLHLLGYDDMCAKDRKEMRKQEKRSMAHLKKQKIML